jgi:hypothetical protein
VLENAGGKARSTGLAALAVIGATSAIVFAIVLAIIVQL